MCDIAIMIKKYKNRVPLLVVSLYFYQHVYTENENNGRRFGVCVCMYIWHGRTLVFVHTC